MSEAEALPGGCHAANAASLGGTCGQLLRYLRLEGCRAGKDLLLRLYDAVLHAPALSPCQCGRHVSAHCSVADTAHCLSLLVHMSYVGSQCS